MNHFDVVVVGGGLGGVAASLAALRLGARVLLTEPSEWLGGQLTVQGVPLDEHPWIETHGCTQSYQSFRRSIREFYRAHYPLSVRASADPQLNPGLGDVSPLCHEPRVAAAVLDAMLMPFCASGQLVLWKECDVVSVQTERDRFDCVTFADRRTGEQFSASGAYFLDATELGDLLALGHVEHVIGAEGQSDTGEPHARSEAEPLGQVAIAWGFALEHRPGENHVVDRPDDYATWRDYRAGFRPGPQLSWGEVDPISGKNFKTTLFVDPDDPNRKPLWNFRRLLCKEQFRTGFLASDVSMVYWMQNDYWLKPVLTAESQLSEDALQGAKSLSASLLYWLQTEAPRPDGGTGYPGLRLRPDITGTSDGFVKFPYVREGRRIVGQFRILEQHLGVKARAGLTGAEDFHDSVGIGCHRLDLHPSCGPREYVDLAAWPFQLPLGALIPVRVENLLPACKNIATTHVTNSAYRFHPVEWNIGECAGALSAFCIARGTPPVKVRDTAELLQEFRTLLSVKLGVPLHWPKYVPLERHFHGPWSEAIPMVGGGRITR